MIIKCSKGWRREIRLEHSPFLKSSLKGKQPEGDWLVVSIWKAPINLLGKVKHYWFKNPKAFARADKMFVKLSKEELNVDADLSVCDDLSICKEWHKKK